MELKDIRQIVELMNKHNLSLFHLQNEGFSLKLRKGADLEELLPLVRSLQPAPGAHPAPAPHSAPGPRAEGAPPAPAAPEPSATREITSPMVGTFYRSVSPEADPFVAIGSAVEESTTVCIIEAMKVMNEIKADLNGTIIKALVEDGSPVQYGQPLFLVNPS